MKIRYNTGKAQAKLPATINKDEPKTTEQKPGMAKTVEEEKKD